MGLSIHNWATRLLISVCIFLIVLSLIVPHLMDVHPPLIVDLLLKPAEWAGGLFGKLIPPNNIGTPEEPFYEATPIQLLAGFALALLCIFLYPFATYLALSLLSRIMRRRVSEKSN